MKVAVIGAGIVGVTTAYELASDGHDVTVLERHGTVAAECSFANAGLVAPGYVTPWAAPGMPRKVLGHLLSRHAPVRVHPTLDPRTLAWMWRWWRACDSPEYHANRLRMQRLATFSRERLRRLTRDLKLGHERRDGYLVLLRSEKDLALVQPGLASLTELNTRFELLDAAQCRAIEPDLSPETPLHGGIHLPDDLVGNCRQFATLLRSEAQRLGVRFRFHTQVERIVAGAAPQLVHRHLPPDDGGAASQFAAEAGPSDAQDTEPMPLLPVTEGFDAVVVCAAMGAHELLRPLGIRLPMQAVYGYSITAPLRQHEAHPDHGPRAALMDERYKVAISRLGTRVRVAGSAEIGGDARRHHPKALATLYKVLHDWFPGSARLNQALVWKGARPMLPDGPPVLGASGVPGVWLNLGHGGSGWALACGSARLLTDAVAGRPASIAVDGLGIERLHG
ncbi:MAG TPA: FAD-dependent oxidoreductase [Burkholderiaceae bacterium]|nr:FAD-dependent oxidoreductase [Burkholderiaceae bacterium]